MGKRSTAIQEMIQHIKRMSDGDKVAFVQFVSKYRSSKSLVNMFRAFEKAISEKENKGLLKSIACNPNGTAYKTFHRFKKKIFEFELSSKRLDHFRKIDPHRYYFIYLKKEILAAEMLTERNAYHISIQLLKDTLKRATEFEYMDLQRDCLRDLAEFSRYSGHPRLEGKYGREHGRSIERLMSYESLKRSFEDDVFRLRCCALHKNQGKQMNGPSFDRFLEKWPSKKVAWMGAFLNAKALFYEGKYDVSLINSIALKRALNFHPGLYPAYLRLSIHLLILENLWFLNKFYLIERYSRKLLRLDHFTAYQRIPMQQYFLYYFLWVRKFEMIDLILEDLKLENAYQHFPAFLARSEAIAASSEFLKGDFRNFLVILNRSEYLSRLECPIINFELRVMEALSLKALNEDLLLEDKLESLRRYVARNEDLRQDKFSSITLQIIKKNELDPGRHLMVFHRIMSNRSVYDLRWIIIQRMIETYAPEHFKYFGKYSSNYLIKEISLNKVAEERPQIH